MNCFQRNAGVTEKADVYSFGIILFELNSRPLVELEPAGQKGIDYDHVIYH